MTDFVTRRIGYLASEYPAVSHTFILREVLGLRAQGVEVVTYSIRAPVSDVLKGADEQAAQESTGYIFPKLRTAHGMAAQLKALWRSPTRFFSALGLALRTSPGGVGALLYQIAYFMEAAILADCMRRDRVTHLHVHFANAGCTVGMLASEMTDIPFSFTMHGPTEFFDMHRLAVPEKLKRARFVACISHFCRSQLMLFLDREAWEKLHIVHCAIDPDFYATSEPKQRDSVLFVGRMSGVKGVPLLLNSVAVLRNEFPNLRVTLVGDGAERTALEVQAGDLGVSDIVTFTGSQTQHEVRALMQQADLFTLPSFAEGLPVVLMEALASGTPVVTTQIAGVGDLVVEGETGLLVAPGDQMGLTDALRRLLGDDAKKSELGKAGAARVRAEFSIEGETRKLRDIFEKTAC